MEETLLEGLGSGSVERMVVARIKPGVDLLEALDEVVRREAVQRGVFMTAVGGLRQAVLSGLRQFPEQFPVTDEDRLYLEIEQPLVVLSLSHHISPREDGTPNTHGHFSAATVEGDTIATVGGQLTGGTVTSNLRQAEEVLSWAEAIQ